MGTVTGQAGDSEAEQPAPKPPLSKSPSIPLQVSAFSSPPVALSLQTAVGPAPPQPEIQRLSWVLALGRAGDTGQDPPAQGGFCCEVQGSPAQGVTHHCRVPNSTCKDL